MTTHELTVDACWQRLSHRAMGRVAFTERALPAILPVPYVLIGNQVLLRCAPDLAGRLDGQVVAFEVDDLDRYSGAGWSVIVTGTARKLSRPVSSVRVTAGEIHGFTLPASPDLGSPVRQNA